MGFDRSASRTKKFDSQKKHSPKLDSVCCGTSKKSVAERDDPPKVAGF